MYLKFKLDKNDLIKYHSDNISTTKTFKKAKNFLYIYVVLIVIITWLGTNDISLRVASVLAVISIILLAKKITKLIYKKTIFKKLKLDKFSYMFEEISMEVKDEILLVKNLMEERHMKLKSIYSINMSNGYLFIIFANTKYFIIPETVFSDIAERNKFISLLEDKSKKELIYSYPDKLAYE